VKVKHVQEGDNNTKYFHLIANGKYRKKKHFSWNKMKELYIVGDENLKTYITEFYKKLFGDPEHYSSLIEERVTDIPQLMQEENDLLIAPFAEEEVFEAISQMEHNKSLGPDGFPAEFYQHFWNVIKCDLLALFTEFHKGELPL
jgi:mannosylglycoprotein endo-beta-mannosidase